jgi:hypothetical protein
MPATPDQLEEVNILRRNGNIKMRKQQWKQED